MKAEYVCDMCNEVKPADVIEKFVYKLTDSDTGKFLPYNQETYDICNRCLTKIKMYIDSEKAKNV